MGFPKEANVFVCDRYHQMFVMDDKRIHWNYKMQLDICIDIHSIEHQVLAQVY